MALRNQFTNTCMFAAVLVTQCVCHGHSGVTFTAEPVKKEIQIDGDLSDWPKSKEYEVSDPYVFNGKPNTTDYTGRFRVACDFQRELLYVAVVIKDDVIVLDSPADRWSSRDACEIFLTLEHSPEQRVPLQFVYRESPIVAEADKRNIELQKSFEVERKQDGNTLTYEWRINLAALPGGKGVTKQAAVLGFDVGYIDRDEGDKVAVFNSSPGQAKHLTTRTLGDLMLFAKSDSLVSVTGNVERATLAGEEGGEVAQRRFAPVGITSVDSPRFYVQVPCDDKGRYEAKVPPGKYTASLFDTLPARMAEK
ncbi:MAG: sugar-binding protein, partial [Planctomycetota bacterium]